MRDLVHLITHQASGLQPNTNKCQQDFIDPLVIGSVVDSVPFEIRDLKNKV